MVLVGPVAHLAAGDRAEVSGEWTDHKRYGRQLRAQAPGRWTRPTARARSPTSPRCATSARPAPSGWSTQHGEGVLRAIAENPHRASPRCAASATTRRRPRPSPGTSRARSATSTSSWPRTGWPTWRPDPRSLRRGGAGGPARGPLPADRGRRGRLRPRRQDRPRRRRAARVRPPRPGRGGLRPRRGRAAGQHLPAGGRSSPARSASCSGCNPIPRSSSRPTGCCSTRGVLTAGTPTSASWRWRGRWRPAWPRRRTSTTSPAEEPPRRRRGTPADRRAVGGGARRLHGAGLGADRRARGRQDGLHAGDRRGGRGGEGQLRPLRADRTGRPPPRGDNRDTRRKRSTACSSWMPGREPDFKPGHPLPGRPRRRRRVLDAQPAPDRGAARRPGRVDPRRLRRRRRPAAADRRRQAVRGPDRVRDRARRPSHPDLPPGGALDDHHRGPRDQPGAPAAPEAGRATRTTTSSSSTAPTRARPGHGGRGGRRAGPEALRGRPDPRRPGAGADVPGGGRDRRPQRARCGSGSTPTASGRRTTASGSATA